MASAYDSASDDESDGGSASYVVSARASSVTTEDWDMRSASPGPSVFSMTSSMRINAFRQEYGRGLNNYSEIYRLPADEEELARLDQQHAMFREIMGKYPPPLYEILADTPGQVKTVVDLGCGSGSWIVDVARDFPHTSCVAVDLIPMQIMDIPPNCRSEVDDINLGLQHFYGEFNVAHARLISTGIRDYKGLVDQIAHVLKPGGLIDLTEFDFRIYNLDKQPIPITMDASPLARWFNIALRAVQMQGGEPDAANHLFEWTRDHGAFEDVQYREWWLQTSPWNPGQDEEARQKNRWGAAMRDDMLAFLKSGRPLLLGTGVPEQILNPLEEEAEREVMEARVPTYVRIQNVYGRRR